VRGSSGGWPTLGAAALTFSLAPGTANADDVPATLPSEQQRDLSAYGGHVVWSERIAPDVHVLMRWRAGRVDRLPVRSRKVPFDLDLGPDARGRAVAVYSRCAGENEWERALPDRRCDVYQLSLTNGRERRLRRISTPRASEFAPTIWRGNIAYASARRSGLKPRLMLLRRGARRPQRLLTGTRVTAISHVRPMDLTSNALVFTWSQIDPARDDQASELRRVALRGGRATILAKEINQEGFGDHANSANATPDETIWVRAVFTPCIETRIVVDRHGKRRMTPPTPREIRALARDRSTLYAITSAPAPCSASADVTLVRLSPPVFAAAR
jgi:hypothetical protein